MTWSHQNEVGVSQKHSRKGDKLDKAVILGAGSMEHEQFASMMLKCRTLPQGDRTQMGEPEWEWEEGSPRQRTPQKREVP